MKLLHYTRRVVCFLLIYSAGMAVVNANDHWQDIETLLENGQYLSAIKQLDQNLINARATLDETEWARILLRGARLRALEEGKDTAINYLLGNQWPTSSLPQSMLNLALAQEYEAYFSLNTLLVSTVADNKSYSDHHLNNAQIVDKINHHYQLAYQIADKNGLKLHTAQDYLTPGSFPEEIKGDVSDVIAAYWQRFIADEMYWSDPHKQLLDQLQLCDLLDVEEAKSPENVSHPLQILKALSKKLIKKHTLQGKSGAAFEVKRYYLQLLVPFFNTDQHIAQLSTYLSKQLSQLGTQDAWWTMGQFQLANWQFKLKQHPLLTEVHDLAVRASIIHPQSLGSQKSRKLINELEFSEYTIKGTRNSGLNTPSIDIEFRNLQRLYFKAWRITKPLPPHMDEELTSVIITTLMERAADSEWTAQLPDQFDLRKQTIQHTPKIDRYGQWLILASPTKHFQKTTSFLQLLSMKFNRYVVSVSYFNQIFNVRVYNNENGFPANNISVDLLKIENNLEHVVASATTDRKGNSVLHRKVDGDYFQIKVYSDDDSSTIDVPSLLPLKDEKKWSKQQEKSLLLTDKETYVACDTIHWSLISRAMETVPSSIQANVKQRAWLKLFDDNHYEVAEEVFITDSAGTASGKISLSDKDCERAPTQKNIEPTAKATTVFRIETSWGGVKEITVLPKQVQPSTQRQKTIASIKLPPFNASYEANDKLNIQGVLEGLTLSKSRQKLHWHLKRTSTQLTGELHASVDIDKGESLTDASGHFGFSTRLSLGEDKHHQLKHRFTLYVEYFGPDGSIAMTSRTIFVRDNKSYYSVPNPKHFFVKAEPLFISLTRNNMLSEGMAGESSWYLYERLPAPHAMSRSYTEPMVTPWIMGGVKQSGTAIHDSAGNTKIGLKPLDAGVYRLRVMPKNQPKQAAFEYDFIVAEKRVSKNIKLSGVLLTETTQLDKGSAIVRLLAGNGHTKKWSRLTISQNNKQLASQMLSPGIHLLKFPISDTHQGGVSFSLEWVDNHQIVHRELQLEVPWSSKHLSVSMLKKDLPNTVDARLQVVDNKKNALADPTNTRVLLYFTEIKKGDTIPSAFDLDTLYWQSPSSWMRLDNNATSYPYYLNQSKHLPQQVSDVVELPAIRYSPNNVLLSGLHSDFIIPSALEEDQPQIVIASDRLLEESSVGWGQQHYMRPNNHQLNKQSSRLTHFSESFLDSDGRINIQLPETLKGRRINLRAVVITPDLKTGQLSVILR